MNVVILGGGPCGLGAAWRLTECGHDNWELYEQDSQCGGLSSSFQDDDGFWWDIGGHVLFSHYSYFDDLMATLFPNDNDWIFHEREAWAWMQDRFIPYPVQNNIHNLPKNIFWECLEGIIDLKERNQDNVPAHFGEWIDAGFGKGLAKWFLRPYNYKVWAYPVEELDWSWVGDRVATIDLKTILRNYLYNKNSISWGPNSQFRFPANGGTGSIWRTLADNLPGNKIHLGYQAVSISLKKREIEFQNGKKTCFDYLLSSIPLTKLVEISDLEAPYDKPPQLKQSSVHIAGLALKGSPPDYLSTKCWMYFPEDNCPFYRVTVFSNYSPNNVPDITSQWSLLCEVSESPLKKVDHNHVTEDIIQGALNTKLIADRNDIHHVWQSFVKDAYPTPDLNRNGMLFPLLRHFEKQHIFSRGRFGSWRYEVGNMDHSLMQGVEFADHILKSKDEVTVWKPNTVNNPGYKDMNK